MEYFDLKKRIAEIYRTSWRIGN